MPHVHTRLKDAVDAVEGAELCCNICGEWKPTTDYKWQKGSHKGLGAPAYMSFCVECKKGYEKLRNRATKFNPSYDEVRDYLGKFGQAALATLNQAHHTGGQPARKPRKLSTREREERRERAEEKAGTPSMCYLVGMEGDRTAVKIGHSTNVYRRMAQYQAGNPRKLIVLALLPGGQQTERELHQKFMHYHKPEFVGEWFEYAPEIMNHFAAGRVS